MAWFVKDLARYESERQAVADLAPTENWLFPIRWRVDNELRLMFEADIVINDKRFPVFLRYPVTYPFSPPSVARRGEGPRWTSHQFLDGELCTEYGPDNWTPDMTGAMVLESAHRLLVGETPVGDEPALGVPSRHFDTVGQQTRFEIWRLVVTKRLQETCVSLPVGIASNATAAINFRGSALIYLVTKVSLPGDAEPTDLGLPAETGEFAFERPAFFYRLADEADWPDTSTKAAVLDFIRPFGADENVQLVVFLRKHETRCVRTYGEQDTQDVAVLLEGDDGPRQSNDHAQLADRSVALIGCGSMGSKIGAMLARAGVRSFVLIDDDLMMPGNIIRNENDWREVGLHKANALSARIKFINPTAIVRMWRTRIGGQESNSQAEAILKAIGGCDLVLDATADPRVLNVLASLVDAYEKPLIFAEVFGGGIGGLMARCRPGVDLPPQYARRAIENWFYEKGCKPEPPRRNYETGELENPLIADDADVSAIAAHASRFALDILLRRDPSHYPVSAYAIGLAPGLVFSQPFETCPIDIPNTLPVTEKLKLSAEDEEKSFTSIMDMIAAGLEK
jgi:ubiquitin-protein ligase